MRFFGVTLTLFLGLGTGALGCAPMSAGAFDVRGDKSEEGESFEALAGHDNPVAAFLRRHTDRAGKVDVAADASPYEAVLDGVGAELGCDGATERVHLVATPRAIFTRCSEDPVGASRFFMDLVEHEGDLGTSEFNAIGWDDAAGRYRHYHLRADPESGLEVTVEPAECLDCHADGPQQDAWVPKMNELTAPWTGWHAGDAFVTHRFEEELPSAFREPGAPPVYREILESPNLAAAPDFEQVARAGMDRVVHGHLARRHVPLLRDGAFDAEGLELALSYLRPLFCDDGATFASESHESGRLRLGAIVDEEIARLFSETFPPDLYPEADPELVPWTWLRSTIVRLPTDGAGTPLLRIPVRYEVAKMLEEGLLRRGILDAARLLQLRALDWRHPVGSRFRCGLFEEGAERIRRGEAAYAIDDLGDPTVGEALPILFDELLRLPAAGIAETLRAPAGKLYALFDAEVETLRADHLSAFEKTPAAFGAEIGEYVSRLTEDGERRELDVERARRVCFLRDVPVLSLSHFDDVVCH